MQKRQDFFNRNKKGGNSFGALRRGGSAANRARCRVRQIRRTGNQRSARRRSARDCRARRAACQLRAARPAGCFSSARQKRGRLARSGGGSV